MMCHLWMPCPLMGKIVQRSRIVTQEMSLCIQMRQCPRISIWLCFSALWGIDHFCFFFIFTSWEFHTMHFDYVHVLNPSQILLPSQPIQLCVIFYFKPIQSSLCCTYSWCVALLWSGVDLPSFLKGNWLSFPRNSVLTPAERGAGSRVPTLDLELLATDSSQVPLYRIVL